VRFQRNIFSYAFKQIHVLLKYVQLKSRKNRFFKFVEEELALTERYDNQEGFLKNVPEFDIYIAGSDQVFHPRSKYLKTYYLGFDKKNSIKIAYAPSFGMSAFSQEIANELKDYLADFDALSCREQDGANFIESIVNKNVPAVVDPTFLLSADEWNEMLIPPASKEKYIFIYDLNGGENLVKIANKIKKETGFKIICQTQKAHVYYNVDEIVLNTGPREFVGLIKGAQYVVTDSFHGVAFSVFLKVKFLTYIAMPNASTRVRSMLASFGLSNRIIENGQAESYVFSSIWNSDYQGLLTEKVLESERYLLQAINLFKSK